VWIMGDEKQKKREIDLTRFFNLGENEPNGEIPPEHLTGEEVF
jgi:hypothetical protein